MTAESHTVRPVKALRVLPIHLNPCWQLPQQVADTKAVFQHDHIYGDFQCTCMMDERSLRHTLIQRRYLIWLLMSNDAPSASILKFVFNSWAQMINFQEVLAECFGIEKIKRCPHAQSSRQRRYYIVVRNLKRSNPAKYSRLIPIRRRSEPPIGESIPEQKSAAMIGLIVRKPHIRRLPDAYLAQARKLLLLNENLRLSRRERIRMSVAVRTCDLLPDRPPWMQTPSEPIWPGKCIVRAGAEPPGYCGRLLSKKELFDRRKKSLGADSLPAKILKLKLKRRVKKQLSEREVDSKCMESSS